MDHDIEFEELVVTGEETTITYKGTVYDPMAETTVSTDIEISIDGDTRSERSYEMEMHDGAEVEAEFQHVFESAGEHGVQVDITFSALRPVEVGELQRDRRPPEEEPDDETDAEDEGLPGFTLSIAVSGLASFAFLRGRKPR